MKRHITLGVSHGKSPRRGQVPSLYCRNSVRFGVEVTARTLCLDRGSHDGTSGLWSKHDGPEATFRRTNRILHGPGRPLDRCGRGTPSRIIGLLLVVLLAGNSAWADFLVQPMLLRLAVQPGKRYTREMKLENSDPKQAEILTLRLAELTQRPDASWTEMRPDDPNISKVAHTKLHELAHRSRQRNHGGRVPDRSLQSANRRAGRNQGLLLRGHRGDHGAAADDDGDRHRGAR